MNVFGNTICRLTDEGDTVQGGSGDDLAIGIVSSTSADSTFNPADVVDLDGGDDTFQLRLIEDQGNGSASSAGRSVQRAETLDVRTVFAGQPTASETASVNLGDFSDLTDVLVSSLRSDAGTGDPSDKLSLSELEGDDTLTISASDSDHDVIVSYDGTPSEDTFVLEGASIDDLVLNGGIQEVTLETAGEASSSLDLDTTDSSDLTKVLATGEQDLSLSIDSGSFDNTVDTRVVDGSGLGENTLTATLDVDGKTSVTGGSSDGDTVNARVGGDIDDGLTTSGVETFTVTDTSNNGVSVDLTNADGVTTVGTSDDQANTITFEETVDNLSVVLQTSGTGEDFAGDINMDDSNDDDDGDRGEPNLAPVAIEVAGASANNPADAVTFEINNGGTDTGVEANKNSDNTTENTITTRSLTANDVKAITVNGADGDVHISGGITADSVETLTFNASEDLLIDAADEADLSAGSNSTIGSKADTTAINASGVQGTFLAQIVDGVENDLTITGAAGNDIIDLNEQLQGGTDTNEFTVELGGGNDTLTVDKLTSGTDDTTLTADFGDGDDVLVVANAVTASDIPADVAHTLSFGDGTDQINTTGGIADFRSADVEGLDEIELDGGTVIVGAGNIDDFSSIQIRSFGSSDTVGFALDGNQDFDAANLSTTGFDGAGSNDSLTIIGGDQDNTITTGAGDDTITGGGGADTLTGGAGADDIDVGNADTDTDTVNIAAGDSVSFTAETVTEGNLMATETITFGNGVDTIQNFEVGAGNDEISGLGTAVPTDAVGSDFNGDNSGTTFQFDGNFNARTGVFTGNTSGTDVLIFEGDATADLASVDTFTVLIGVDDTSFDAANFVA